MDKVSRYAILSDHEYADTQGSRWRLVFTTRAARLVPVRPEVGAALETGHLDEISPDTLDRLREAQILVPAEQDELAKIVEENTQATTERSAIRFALLPTSYCNMGCAYCGQQHTRGPIGAEHRDRVRARVLARMELASTRSVHIDWFGAEPMVGYPMIHDLSKDFVRVAAERGLPYTSTIITNGSLLTPKKVDVLIRECRVSHFEVTLDGPPEVHDVHRPLKRLGGSFWKIVNTLQTAVSNPDYLSTVFQFRTNVDVHNVDHIEDYIVLMAELGFARPNVSFSIAPVHSWGNDVTGIALGKQPFADRELTWLRLLQEHGLRFGLLPKHRKRVVCGAVNRATELISSTGNIFSCSEQPLVPEAEANMALANIMQDGLPVFRPKGPFDDWNETVARGETWCRDCTFLPTCGGSCPKAWTEGNPPCPSYKFNIQGRIDLAAQRNGYRRRQATT